MKNILPDGIYNVVDIPFIYLKERESTEQAIAFIKRYGEENIYFAEGYQTTGVFIFASKPKPVEITFGSFGSGAVGMFADCP